MVGGRDVVYKYSSFNLDCHYSFAWKGERIHSYSGKQSPHTLILAFVIQDAGLVQGYGEDDVNTN